MADELGEYNQLCRKRKGLARQCVAMIAAAQGEGRPMTAEECDRFDVLARQADALKPEIERLRAEIAASN